MSSAVMEPVAAPPRTTTAELLARPDDGVERWLVDGVIEEVGMTMRYKRHTAPRRGWPDSWTCGPTRNQPRVGRFTPVRWVSSCGKTPN